MASSGQRRQKVLGYLKAANELRQTYQSQLSTRWQEGDYPEGMPGGFPDADIVRSGDEEMLLFPSYARRHVKVTDNSQGDYRSVPGAREDLNNPDSGDDRYWKREWQKYEDENAVVDVDVRGWIYSPQRGPLTRRNRLLLAVARRLSGIPVPTNSPTRSRESSQAPGWRERVHEDLLSQEEEAAAREADLIARRGQREAEAASRGNYSVDNNSLLDMSPINSRSSSPARPVPSRMNTASSFSPNDNASLISAPSNNASNLSYQMTHEEIVTANEQLMIRLRPFMNMPLSNAPITVFFFNDSESQPKSVYTDESGHFRLRAALNFVPTKVRVLASENLSATEDVVITESQGISLVSDIDDTIKHSAIASGAKEIFKNTFIRDLGELTIPGVKEWYAKLASMGVDLHYVSNSPWQLYPLLKSYFAMAGLPPGSFHLKQYSGMLQGIFEPAAERKKGSLDKIMQDFPERKFILIGDSGEADLEVYTDIVQEHPGRVLGVFIRDVTSKEENNLKDFFYGGRAGDAPWMQRTNSAQVAGRQTQESNPPKLPERPKSVAPATEYLIDLGEDSTTPTSPRSSSYSKDLEELQQNGKSTSNRPAKPAKPSNLRSFSTASPPPSPNRNAKSSSPARLSEGEVKKYAPPPPPAPRRTATGLSTMSTASNSTHTSAGANTNGSERFYAQRTAAREPPLPPNPRTLWQESSHYNSSPNIQTASRLSSARPTDDQSISYLASARQQLASAYNALPAIRPQTSGSSTSGERRGISSFPPAAAAARFVTGATGGDPYAGGDGGAAGQPYDRKLEMWRRRWARSEDIMRRQGVVLRTWRNGTDVMDECVKLVERGLRNIEKGR